MRASWKFVLAAVLAVAPCSSGKETSPAGDGDDDLVAVEARDGPLELVKLLEIAAEVTGEPFFFDPAALHGLRARPIETKAILRRRLLAYLDDQLREADCTVVERIVAGVRCHRVVSRSATGRTQAALKAAAEVVTPDELAAIADRSKLVTTAVTFRSIGLAAGMDHCFCYRHNDTAAEALVRVQGTSVWFLTGTAENVAQEVALIRRLDAAGIPSEFEARLDAHFDALSARVAALEAALAGR